MKRILLCALFVLLSVSVRADDPKEAPIRWWKGNLQRTRYGVTAMTFQKWSPTGTWNTVITSCVCPITNILSRGQRWMPLETIVSRSNEEALPRYQRRFGKEWVELKGVPTDADCQVRLKPLDEFRHLVEQADKFIMIQGEEISDKAEGKPVHMNATNLTELIQQ